MERAALIQAARIWTRAADFEPFYVDADVDTDVRLLLEPYRKPSGAIGGQCRWHSQIVVQPPYSGQEFGGYPKPVR